VNESVLVVAKHFYKNVEEETFELEVLWSWITCLAASRRAWEPLPPHSGCKAAAQHCRNEAVSKMPPQISSRHHHNLSTQY
jgi:hypothetical protein